jgi:copper chaperone
VDESTRFVNPIAFGESGKNITVKFIKLKTQTMKTMQFKTNIKCSDCVANLTLILNKTVGGDNWKVDIQSPNKILTVSADGHIESDIQAAFEKTGYTAEKFE